MATFNHRAGHHRAGKTFLRMDILPPEKPSGRKAFRAASSDAIDAHFVPVVDGSRRRQSATNDNRGARPVAGKAAAATRPVAARAEGPLRLMSADLFCALVAVAFILVFAAFGGFTFLFKQGRAAPASHTLDITHVTMTPQDADGMKVLLINGIVENDTDAARSMPAIRADLVSGDTVLSSTLITMPAATLGVGESRGFSARVAHPLGRSGGKLPDLRLSIAPRDVSRS